jgi:hypothetical protein
MHERVRRLNGHVRHADEVKHRQMLGIRASDRGDRAKLADAVGRADRADPIDSSVAVRGVRRVQLITTRDPTDFRVLANCVVDGEREVPGTPKTCLTPISRSRSSTCRITVCVTMSLR